jgi:uncharacterized tellurite resistance protein B-like protein
MFLNAIDKKCRESVLDLALLIAHSDNDYCEAEKEVIKAYKKEMEVSYEPRLRGLDDILNSFTTMSISDKKKILFEMACLVIADSNFSDEEEAILKKTAQSFGIEESFISASIEIYDDLNMLYQKASKLVN